MKKLCVASLMAAFLICVVVDVAWAQSTPNEDVPFCGNLTASDCARLEAIPTRMAALTSGSSQNQIHIFATWEAIGSPELSLTATSDYTFVIDADDLARMHELQMMSPAELAADTEALADAIRLPALVDRAQIVTVDLAPELIQNLADNFDVVVPATISFQVRVINQVLYIRLADFAFLGAQPEWVPEWLGIEFRHFLNLSVNAQVTNPDLGEDDIAAIQRALVPPGSRLANNIIYHIPADQLAAYADFMSLTAQGMQEFDSTLVMVFTTEWDVPRYIGGPLFAEQIDMGAYPSVASRAYANFATLMLDGLATTSRQRVDVDDSLLYAVETDIVWAIGLPGGTFLAERPTVGIELNLHNRDLNRIESIPVPSGAVTPPLNLIFAIINLLRS